MKPLVYYARWQGAKLRLRGRNDTAVWGELVYLQDDGSEETQPFRFSLESAALTLQEGEETEIIHLDEMGVAVDE